MTKDEVLEGLKAGRRLRCDRKDEPLLPWLLSHPNIKNSGVVQPSNQSSYIEFWWSETCQTLKLNRPHGSLVTIELIIKAKPYDFILDTGATHSGIMAHLLPALSEEIIQNGRSRDYHGHGGTTTEIELPIRVNLIGVSLRRISPISGHLIKIGTHVCGARFGGLIGLDVLSQFRSVEFLFAEQKVRFLK